MIVIVFPSNNKMAMQECLHTGLVTLLLVSLLAQRCYIPHQVLLHADVRLRHSSTLFAPPGVSVSLRSAGVCVCVCASDGIPAVRE